MYLKHSAQCLEHREGFVSLQGLPCQAPLPLPPAPAPLHGTPATCHIFTSCRASITPSPFPPRTFPLTVLFIRLPSQSLSVLFILGVHLFIMNTSLLNAPVGIPESKVIHFPQPQCSRQSQEINTDA